MISDSQFSTQWNLPNRLLSNAIMLLTNLQDVSYTNDGMIQLLLYRKIISDHLDLWNGSPKKFVDKMPLADVRLKEKNKNHNVFCMSDKTLV